MKNKVFLHGVRALCGNIFFLADSTVITLALSKGRIFDETLPLLARAGIQALDDPDTSRKLILRTSRGDLRLLIVRAADVPTYVQHGASELGVAGKDVLLEHGGEGLYQPLDLGIASCRMMVAVPEGFDYAGAVRQGARLRVATRSEEHTSELQSQSNLVCRLLLEKKKKKV